MKEIEVKILDINPEEIRKKILDLGAEEVFNGQVDLVRFDYPDGRLEKNDTFFRVRRLGNRYELCFKNKQEESSQYKVREEIEVITDNFEDTITIIERIGLKKVHESSKHRESYKLGDVKFEIDTWKDIPTFLEIEAPTEEKVKEYVEKLGYTMDQTTNMTVFQLEDYYKNKK